MKYDISIDFITSYDEDSSWPIRILWTNEAHFTLIGNMYSKNCVCWADNNPRDVFASPLQDEKVTM